MCHWGFTWGNTMEDLNLLFESWDLSQLHEKNKKKKTVAKDPISGIAMQFYSPTEGGEGVGGFSCAVDDDLAFNGSSAYTDDVPKDNPKDKEEDNVTDSGGIAINFGDIGSTEGMFNPGNTGTGEAGGMA